MPPRPKRARTEASSQANSSSKKKAEEPEFVVHKGFFISPKSTEHLTIWENTEFKLTKEVEEQLKKHPELKKIIEVYNERANVNEPVSLTAKSGNFVALYGETSYKVDTVSITLEGNVCLTWPLSPTPQLEISEVQVAEKEDLKAENEILKKKLSEALKQAADLKKENDTLQDSMEHYHNLKRGILALVESFPTASSSQSNVPNRS